ncbi:MAG: hypothetical protein C0478_11045 [Planctomyces sp.]|nr:hypothetical protein [Planctomyces sp.]
MLDQTRLSNTAYRFTSRRGADVTVLGWAMMLGWLISMSPAPWMPHAQAQSLPPGNVIPTEFSQDDQRLVFTVANAMHNHPELYYYLCTDDSGREIVRPLKAATTKPGGKHPEKPPIVVMDIKLDRFGTKPQPKARKYLEDLIAAHNKRRAAGVMVAQGPAPHLMGGGGVAPGPYVPPDPRQMPKPQVDPATKNSSQAIYAMIAGQITQSYRLRNDDVIGKPLENLMAAVETNGADEAIKRAAGRIAQLTRDSADRLEAAKEDRDFQIRYANERMNRAERGDFIREEQHEWVDSDGRTYSKTVVIDDNESVYNQASRDLARAEGNTDFKLKTLNDDQKHDLMHTARARAWDELVPVMPDKFAGPVSNTPLVAIRFVPEERPIDKVYPYPQYSTGYSERFQGKYVAKNVSGKELRHATFAVDFYHFSTMPEVATRHVYYVPRWGKGEDLEMSRMLVPDKTRGGYRYKIPTTDHINDPPHFELDGMAGVLKMDLMVWSNEAKQNKTTVTFRERADTIAPVLLAVAEKTLTSSQFNFAAAQSVTKAAKSKPAPAKPAKSKGGPPKKPVQSMEERATTLMAGYLSPLIEVLPKSSPYSEKARHYLVDPKGARENLQKSKQSGLLAACAVGKRYEGDFNGRKGNGKFGILFTECSADGNAIRAEIYNPANPKQTRPLGGYVAINRKTTAEFVFLMALAPASEWTKSPIDAISLDPFAPAIQTYGFEWVDGKLKGMCTTGNSLSDYVYTATDYLGHELAAVSSDSSRLEEARQRIKANPKWKIPKPGQTSTGQSDGKLPTSDEFPRGNPFAPRGTPAKPPGINRKPSPGTSGESGRKAR